MPKKPNFLGGMQNYNPNNGEYEPALVGANGKVPQSFKSFKKGDEKNDSFDDINEKRMGKKKSKKEDQPKEETKSENIKEFSSEKEAQEYFNEHWREFPDGTVIYGNKIYFKDDEMDEDAIWDKFEKGEISEEERNNLLSKRTEKIAKSDKVEVLSKEYFDEFYEKANGDEDKMLDLIRKDERYQNMETDPTDTFSMGDLQGMVEAYMDKKTGKSMIERYREKLSKRA